MSASYLTTQIPAVVKDAVSDLLGNSKATKLTSTGIVSLGKYLSDHDLLDGWFAKLANRIVETRYMIREYTPNTRKVMRNAHDYGAFIQKVYYVSCPDPSDNTVYQIPDSNGDYKQHSPYDVQGSVGVQSMVYGGTGTWTLELIRPIEQIENAFTDRASMNAFIAGLYLYVDNQFKLQEESVANLAVNTGMANAFLSGQRRNLLAEYNAMHDSSIITVADALRSADFLKYASMEISRLIDNMGKMVTVFNKKSYQTFTPKDRLIAEVLTQFDKATQVYLQADTYHDELIKLPNFDTVEFWQSCGSRQFAFADCSNIHIKNTDLADKAGDPTELNQSGIIAFLRDEEYVAATFKKIRKWELPNQRDDIVIHGEKAKLGFAIDNFMNAFVLYIEDTGSITVSGDSNAVLKYTHAYDGIENSITVSAGKVPSATGVTFTQVGETNTYTFTPASNAAFTITVANAS